MVNIKIKIKGMHCTSCETLIEKSIKRLKGVNFVKADYTTEIVEIDFDTTKIKIFDIKNLIEEKGYIFSEINNLKKIVIIILF